MISICKTQLKRHTLTLVTSLSAYLFLSTVNADSVTFQDIVRDNTTGISYERSRSSRDDIFTAIKEQKFYTVNDMNNTPLKSRGAPGVAIFDYDKDGDLDIYVTNGPNASNKLFSNQLKETGNLTFIDVARAAGLELFDQDSNGVCYGDIDNDDDHDLFVLGAGSENRFFENQGDGTFVDITEQSGVGGNYHYSSSCSFGDINADGLLDVVVANTLSTWDTLSPIIRIPFDFNIHNQLFLNSGHNTFSDHSFSSGIRELAVLPQGAASITWAIAMVDYDLDGDIDIIQADDQGPIRSARLGGIDRGIIHVFQNNGTGHFSDVSVAANTNITGGWMGLSFGDINSDGYLDFFATNVSDYFPSFLGRVVPAGTVPSRWFLGQANGIFKPQGSGALITTPFGWGTSMADYNNDGDTDIVFHGGLDMGAWVDASNPGVLLDNDGKGNFSYDSTAFAGSTDHSRRNVQGMAVGDLNKDGFVDIVSVSNFNSPRTAALIPYPSAYGSPFDDTAFYTETFVPTGRQNEFIWSGVELLDGSLSVELNSADNENNWLAVRVKGSIGLISCGQVNRDGIGAVVHFTPMNGSTVMQPVLGGASYASQDGLEANFGLGSAKKGTVEVLWPNGVRNRLYNVRASDHITFPEIPCSFDAHWDNSQAYRSCLHMALKDLSHARILTRRQAHRYFVSALRAHLEYQHSLDKRLLQP